MTLCAETCHNKVTRSQVNCISTKSFRYLKRDIISQNVSSVHKHTLAHVFGNVIHVNHKEEGGYLLAEHSICADRKRKTVIHTLVVDDAWS